MELDPLEFGIELHPMQLLSNGVQVLKKKYFYE